MLCRSRRRCGNILSGLRVWKRQQKYEEQLPHRPSTPVLIVLAENFRQSRRLFTFAIRIRLETRQNEYWVAEYRFESGAVEGLGRHLRDSSPT
jgi:hypothetical protein